MKNDVLGEDWNLPWSYSNTQICLTVLLALKEETHHHREE